MIRELHWAGILFGSGAGLVGSFILFAVSGTLGQHTMSQLIIQFLGFVTAGYVAARFSLTHQLSAARIASLTLFFVIATAGILADASTGVVGLALLGGLSLLGGAAGAALERARLR